MIKFKCKCGQKFSVEEKHAGGKGKCPQCKEVVNIPESDHTDIVDDSINNSVNENSHKPRKNPIRGNTVQGNFISIDEKRIHFTCQQCEEVMTAPKALFGKTILCGICGSNVIVPDNKPQLELKVKPVANSSDQTYTSTDEHQQIETSSGMPAWIWCLYGATAVVIISVILYLFVFRDTWEIDHYSELSQLFDETQSYISEDDFDGATKKYNQLSALIGDRQLEKEVLKDSFANVQTEYGTLKKIIREERQRQAELSRLEELRRKATEEKRRLVEADRKRKKEAEIALKLKREKELFRAEKFKREQNEKVSILCYKCAGSGMKDKLQSDIDMSVISSQPYFGEVNEVKDFWVCPICKGKGIARITKGQLNIERGYQVRKISDNACQNLLNSGLINRAEFVGYTYGNNILEMEGNMSRTITSQTRELCVRYIFTYTSQSGLRLENKWGYIVLSKMRGDWMPTKVNIDSIQEIPIRFK